MAKDESKDFFISYNKADRGWAEWIAWQLEAEGYSTIIQTWDFRPGGNFVLQMNEATKNAKRMIAVLSPSYLSSLFSQSEWAAAFAQDPTGQKRTLLPVRVCECELTGLLAQLIFIDIVNLTEADAHDALLKGIQQGRIKPSGPLPYPGSGSSSTAPVPEFPGLLWNVPYRRNPFFTGREDLLNTLHERLSANKSARPQAISGLGGIGKTQVAIEYAYQHRKDYRTILWVNAATLDTLISDFVALATLLSLAEQHEQDQNRVVAAVRRWFTLYGEWLLILDNADKLEVVADFIPVGDSGHILLTTRDQAIVTIAQTLEIEKMDREQGTLLLLRRIGVLMLDATLDQASEEDQTTAEVLVQEMDGLPLALDQAGAYITQMNYNLSRYLILYRQHQTDLLKWRRRVSPEYPRTVVTTWSLSFEQAELRNPAAADLLRVCAFLDPDAIPEAIITQGASELGPLLQSIATDDFQLNEAIDVLLSFSLIRRLADTHSLTIHRLVQVVLKDSMDQILLRQWAERTVRAVNAALPSERWLHVQSLLPHALACAKLIEQYHLHIAEASRLLDQTATYLQEAARYGDAELLFQQALAIREQTLGQKHSDTGSTLNNLAVLYREQGRYEEAEPLFQRALAICEQTLGSEHSDTSITLDNLSQLYHALGRYEEAEPLCQRALAIKEKILGLEHPSIAIILDNLGKIYREQGRYEEAEPLFQRALAIEEKALEPEHPDIAITLNNLSLHYLLQGRYEEAEPLSQRALAIEEKALGPEHPDTAAALDDLARIYHAQGRYEEAEPLFQRALAIKEKILGPKHHYTCSTLNNLALLYQDQGHYEKAEPLFQRILTICEQTLGPEHPDTMIVIGNYVRLLRQMNRSDEARQLEVHAQEIRAEKQH